MFNRVKNLLFPVKRAKNSSTNVPLAQSDPRCKSDILKSQGDEQLTKGNFSEAEILYRDAINFNPDNAKANCNLGFVLKEKNLFKESEYYLKHALSIDPEIADAHYMLGTLFQQKGELRNAEMHFRLALNIEPNFPFCTRDLCLVLFQNGDIENAKKTVVHGITLHPDFADLHLYLGNLYCHAEEFDIAINCYQKAATIQPQNSSAYFSLGNAYQQQDMFDDAIANYKTALSLKNDYVEALYNLGLLLQKKGDLDVAAGYYQKALNLNPGHFEVYNNLGLIFEQKFAFDVALEYLQKAINIKPDFAEAHYNMGIVFQRQGNSEEALGSYQKAFFLQPDFAEARLANVMAQVAPQAEAKKNNINQMRAKFLLELIEFENWCKVNDVDGKKVVGSNQPFYLSYHEENNRELFSRYGALCSRLMKVWQDKQKFSFDDLVSSDTIRVAIMSADLQNHSVWHAITKGWFQHLDQTQFEICGFYLGSNPDEHTAFAASKTIRFEQGVKGLHQWIDVINACKPDVIIYPAIGMHPLTLQLASMRLAPIQVAVWGHPDTSGLPTIDYYLSAECFEPPNAQNHYSEQLISLPNLGCSYQALHVLATDPNLQELGLNVNAPILVCPGGVHKYDPQYDWIFVEIAQRVGDCNIVFFVSESSDLGNKLRGRMKNIFALSGLDSSVFCKFIPWQTRSAFFGLMDRANVFLDTIGFSGFNTAMQAIECGLPVVTREGRFMRGRLASGILKRIGLPELIASDENEYINLVVRLVQDTAYQKELRKQIEERRFVLFDDVTSVRALEKFLITVVNEKRH
jgi:predicted O-linked N-acetylglucosamine transferase (SPINDLY family)